MKALFYSATAVTLCSVTIYLGAFSAAADTALSPRSIMVGGNDVTQQAEQLLEQRAYGKAARLYRSAAAVVDDPADKAYALVREADCYLAAEDYRKAYKKYRKAYEQVPQSMPYDHVAAQLRKIADAFEQGEATLFGMGGTGKAREVFEFIIDMAPARRGVGHDMVALGNLQRQEGKHREAIDTYRQVERRFQGSEAAHKASLERTKTLLELAELEEGSQALIRRASFSAQQFLEENPDHALAGEMATLSKRADELLAGNLLYLATFYMRDAHSTEDTGKAVRRYLSDVIRTYPDTEAADRAETLLEQLESQGQAADSSEEETVAPESASPEPETTTGGTDQQAAAGDGPAEGEQANAGTKILEEGKVKKWLVPVEDLGL